MDYQQQPPKATTEPPPLRIFAISNQQVVNNGAA